MFERGFGEDCQEKLNPYEARTQLVQRYRMDQECDDILNRLCNDKTCHGINDISKDNQWKYFRDEEMEREFWLTVYQKAIRQSLHTLKQNAEERPLAEIAENEEKRKEILAEEERYLTGLPQSKELSNSSNNNKSNYFHGENVMGKSMSSEHRTFERYRTRVGGNENEMEKTKSKGPSITVVNANGQMKQFQNLDEYEKNG